MQREILFKAKRKDNKKWCYGDLINDQNEYFIGKTNCNEVGDVYYERIEVIPETVSQYTGLTDKNGVKIFENDVVKCKNYSGIQHKEIVKWVEDDGYIRSGYYPLCDNYYDCGLNYSDFEVIGNIFDEEVK